MAKKLTMKELAERINIIAYNLNVLKTNNDSVSIAFAKYLRFKDDESDFKNFLENMQNVDKLNEGVENDTKWYEYYR